MQSLPKINILLVDDREENLISLAAVLDSPDYNLVKVSSGPEALRALLDDDFALILLDVQMPGMDGFETANFIKKRERSKYIPIIFVTAISKDEPFIFKGYDAGAVDYLSKPVEPTILRSKVAVFADLHRKTMKIQQQADLLRQNEKLAAEREIAKRELESLRREQAANERYRDLVDGINHGIVWAANPDTMMFSFVSSKAESITGFSIEKWQSDKNFWYNHVYPDDSELIKTELQKARQNKHDSGFEHRFIRADGEVIWFHTGIRCIENEVRGLSVEITHLKRAEEFAQKAIKVRDEFLSIASHELKTPLTPLKLQLQNLRRLSQKGITQDLITEKLPKALDSSDRQIERFTRLVDELLDVSRINNGKLILEPEMVDLCEVAKEMCARFSLELSNAKCPVELLAPHPVVGLWDKLRIEQVVINLLNNAMKYGPGKPIKITVTQQGANALFSIQDHGIGIPKEYQERIFKQFERAVASINFGGLGLGLYIVSQILTAHHGVIRVDSEVGQGSTFTVTIPLQSTAVQKTDLSNAG